MRQLKQGQNFAVNSDCTSDSGSEEEEDDFSSDSESDTKEPEPLGVTAIIAEMTNLATENQAPMDFEHPRERRKSNLTRVLLDTGPMVISCSMKKELTNDFPTRPGRCHTPGIRRMGAS